MSPRWFVWCSNNERSNLCFNSQFLIAPDPRFGRHLPNLLLSPTVRYYPNQSDAISFSLSLAQKECFLQNLINLFHFNKILKWIAHSNQQNGQLKNACKFSIFIEYPNLIVMRFVDFFTGYQSDRPLYEASYRVNSAREGVCPRNRRSSGIPAQFFHQWVDSRNFICKLKLIIAARASIRFLIRV